MIKDRHKHIFNSSINPNAPRNNEQQPDSEFTKKRRKAEKMLDERKIEQEYKVGGGL